MKKTFSTCLVAAMLFGTSAFSQDMTVKETKPPLNWHQLDPSTTGYSGISLDKAYEFLKSKKLKNTRIVVAVIDSGIDTLHEDLKPILWTNPGEIPGNGKDDDHNGYIDDVHGWNFIGGKDGRNVKEDSYEAARVYHSLKARWEGKEVNESSLSAKDKAEYQMFVKSREKVVGDVDQEEAAYIKQIQPKFMLGDAVIRKELGKEEYNGNDLKAYSTNNIDAKLTKNIMMGISKANNSYDITNQQLIDDLNGQIRKAESATKAPPEYRKDIVKDNENDINDRYYGNNDIMAGTPFHGTHCSGIIAAVRNNDKGVDGIADNVRIMMVRAVPDGDEHDKDIANAIRYAVNNGARVISMSFGKDFSPQKQWVDDAFRYAESKGVLLVHAAGNDHKNVDSTDNFPNPIYVNGKGKATNVITVGASGDVKNGGLTASFSNFGKKEVDVFAPGVNIHSTVPGVTTYGDASGTSMACPVVAGVAALILQYYPNLTPQQLKMAIEKSAQAPKEKVKLPGTDQQVDLADISKTGGIVNAYEAVKYASTIQTKKVKQTLPKAKIRKTKMG
ncbi:MAG: peptidase [Ferruginibacter sp.]|nr:peptidase [Ferruginibacter sp.]